MSDGHRTLVVKINYKELRKTSPEAARQAVLHYWQKNGRNIAKVARASGINRYVVRQILHEQREGDSRQGKATDQWPLLGPMCPFLAQVSCCVETDCLHRRPWPTVRCAIVDKGR